MTEKRFKYTFEGIEDTFETDEEYKYTPCNKDGFQDLCEMLNELHEENEQLKSRVDYLERKIQRERNATTNQHLRWSDEAETKIKELSEENEQLKQQEKKLYTYFKNYFDNIPEESFKESWELIKDMGDVE